MGPSCCKHEKGKQNGQRKELNLQILLKGLMIQEHRTHLAVRIVQKPSAILLAVRAAAKNVEDAQCIAEKHSHEVPMSSVR